VSHAEFFAQLFRFATGWRGWPPAAALATPMPQIEVALEGRVEMLKVIFGGEKKSNGRAHQVTPEMFDVVFGKNAEHVT